MLKKAMPWEHCKEAERSGLAAMQREVQCLFTPRLYVMLTDPRSVP